MQHDPIEFIMSDPVLSDGARVVLFWLWHLAGRKPNRIITNKHELAALTRRDIRTMEKAIKALNKAGRIDIEWDKERGAIDTYVYHPAPSRPEPRPDPQQRFPFTSAGENTAPPASGLPAAADSDPCAGRGGLERSAQDVPTSSAQDVPTRTSQGHAPQEDDDSGLERFAQNVPSPQCLKEAGDKSAPSKRQRTVRSNEDNERAGAVDECDPQDLHVSTAVAGALNQAVSRYEQATHPNAQKRRLKRRILAAAGVEDPDWWVAGNGADLVITHGYPIDKMQALLDELTRRRQLGPNDRNRIENPGGWLQTRLAEVAHQCGAQWGCASDGRGGRGEEG